MKMTERFTAFAAVCALAAGFFSCRAEPEYIDKTPAPDKTPPAEGCSCKRLPETEKSL